MGESVSDAPRILATVQVAHINPSTSGRRAIQLLEKPADAVRENTNGVQEAHAVSAVAGTGPPLRTENHFWTAAPSTMTASTIMMVVQIVRIHPSV